MLSLEHILFRNNNRSFHQVIESSIEKPDDRGFTLINYIT
jgi:hypothetical protein